MEHMWDHHHTAGPPGMYQQPQYILVDEHEQDQWPGPAPAPLPPLPGVASQPPGKPMYAPLAADDELTESEDEHPAPGGHRTAALWQHAALPPRRPESALTGTSQPSPTPSVSLAAPAQAAAPKGGSKAAAPKARKPGGKGGITLRLLIEEGILQPGHNVLSVDYKGMKQMATLMPDGRISSTIKGQEMVFESPSAFSIYLKRLVNPSRKADDGWKTVRYQNRVLEQYKAELAKRRLAEGSSGVSNAAVPAPAAVTSEQQYQQPSFKRARVDSSSDLTGGSVAVSATVKEGDRNVLKLKFARPKKAAESSYPSAAQGVSQPAASLPADAVEEHTGSYRTRPRRQVQAPPRYHALGHDDEHALQPLEAYGPGPPGAPGAQPFNLYVSPAAEIVMDFHAHLCTNEVIGILAGRFDPASRTISVLRAHPVSELATEDDSINVEMDPEDEWRVRQQIVAAGMRPVGFYHSHPTFPTQPSTIDIYNQVLQQHHHRDESGVEPYVAAIVGPYDKRLPSAQSSITWFYVDHPPGRLPGEGQRPEDVGCVAKALQTLHLVDGSTQAELAAMPTAAMQQLAQRYCNKPSAVNMAGIWRDGSSAVQKLVASLLGRLAVAEWDGNQIQEFVSKMQNVVMSSLGPTSVLETTGIAATAVAPGASMAAVSAAEATGLESEDEEISDISG